MTISSAKAKLGLSATGTYTGTGVTGTARIGPPDILIPFAAADVAYTLTAIIPDGSTLVLDQSDCSTAGSAAWVTGRAQVETATAAGTITTAGNATVTVTAEDLAGSPLAITVPVALSDTASLWAAKVRAALAANAVVAAMFTVSGTTTAIILTRKIRETFLVGTTTVNTYWADDATLNIALADDTSAGITEAATSADTLTGIQTSGCYTFDGDGMDFEGNAPAMLHRYGIKIEASVPSGAYGTLVKLGDVSIPPAIATDASFAHFHPTPIALTGFSLTADGADTLVTITVIGATI